MEHIHAFWSGPPLSAYEELCLTSFVRRGQRVSLYSHDPRLRVPEGVELHDASEIVQGDRVHQFVYPTGETSAALHSDIFRYEVLHRFGGWYIDLDILMLAETLPSDAIYLGRQDDGCLNGAVMKLPAKAPVLTAAIDEVRVILAQGHAEWGSIGPALLTRLIPAFALEPHVRSWRSAFPVMAGEAIDVFLPEHGERLLEQTAGADFVHLWNEIWRRIRIPKDLGPPEGSFLDALFRRHGMTFRPEARLPADAIRSWRSDFFLLHQLRTRFEGRSIDELWHAVEERNQIIASTTWRVTRPIRAGVEALRRIRGSLRRGK